MTIHVFFSYDSDDRLLVGRLKDGIENRSELDIDIYIYEEDRRLGEPIATKAKDRIRQSDLFVVLITPNSQHSMWVHQEIGFAEGVDCPVVPIVLDEVDLRAISGLIGGVEYIAIDPDNPDEFFREFLAYIERRFDTRPIEAQQHRGKRLRNDADNQLAAGEFDRAIATYEQAIDAFEYARDLALDRDDVDPDEISRSIEAIEGDVRAAHRTRLNEQVGEIRSQIERAETIADDGGREDAGTDFESLDERLSTLMESAVTHEFADLQADITALKHKLPERIQASHGAVTGDAQRSEFPSTSNRRRRLLKFAGLGAGGVSLLGGASLWFLNRDGTSGPDGGGGGASSGTRGEPFVVGALEPMSGGFANYGRVHTAGLELAIKEINEQGGVLDGRNIRLTVHDTESTPNQAIKLFQKLAEQGGLVATTGAVSSSVGVSLKQVAQDLEIAHLLHMAEHPEVTTGDARYIFRVGSLSVTSFIHAQQVVFGSDYESVGVVIADFEWGHLVASEIERYFDQEVNIQVAPVGATDFRSYIKQFDDGTEMVIAGGHPFGAVQIANQIGETGLRPEVVTGVGLPPNVLIKELSEAGRAVYTHSHISNPYTNEFARVARRFAEDYSSQFNTHTAYGYVTGKIIAEAVDRVESDDPRQIATAIREIEFDSLLTDPIIYDKFGDLDGMSVLFSRLLPIEPPYDPDGTFGYELIGRSPRMS